jgi:hypothetical protein
MGHVILLYSMRFEVDDNNCISCLPQLLKQEQHQNNTKFCSSLTINVAQSIRYPCLKSNLFIQGVLRKIIWATLYSARFKLGLKMQSIS